MRGAENASLFIFSFSDYDNIQCTEKRRKIKSFCPEKPLSKASRLRVLSNTARSRSGSSVCRDLHGVDLGTSMRRRSHFQGFDRGRLPGGIYRSDRPGFWPGRGGLPEIHPTAGKEYHHQPALWHAWVMRRLCAPGTDPLPQDRRKRGDAAQPALSVQSGSNTTVPTLPANRNIRPGRADMLAGGKTGFPIRPYRPAAILLGGLAP